MKATIEPLEITEEYFNRHNNVKEGQINVLDIDYNVDLFIYTDDEDRDNFRIILEWWYRVKDKERTFNVFIFEATQEIFIQFDGNNDKIHLRNTMGTAEMRFMDRVKEKLTISQLTIQHFKSNQIELLVSEVLRLTKH